MAGISTSADPVHPDEAIAWFRERVPVHPDEWHALDAQARRRAFTVSGVSALDVLSEVWEAIDRAIATGTSYEDFRRDVRGTLASEWGGEIPGRIDTIFRTNVQSGYGAGRYRQLTDPEVLHDRPYWMFDAILDSRTSPICRPLDHTVKPANDPWWSLRQPPLHFNCRSSIISLTGDQATEQGLTHHEPDADPPLEGFGRPADLSEWQPEAADYPPELWNEYQRWTQARR